MQPKQFDPVDRPIYIFEQQPVAEIANFAPLGRAPHRPRRRMEKREGTVAAKSSWLVAAFLMSLIVPWSVHLGSLAFPFYRFVLFLAVLPCLFMWLSGKGGRVRSADILLILYCFWCGLSLTIVHGIDVGVQSGGMIFIETIGPYMLARCCIRSSGDFHKMASVLFRIVAFLLPFALYEAVFKHNVARDLFATIMPSFPDAYEGDRLGLRRVQGLFEHPILFGVFTGGILALVHLVIGYQKSLVSRWWRTAIVCATAFLSLSAGPITALAAQGGLVAWNSMLKRIKYRWKILWGLVALMYIVVEFASSQSVPAFYISRFSFDQGSAWQRLLIWEFGSASALNHPVFGVGYGEWERPFWLTSSIDMFWLVHAIRHGLPAAVLFLLAFFVTVLTVGYKRDLDEKQVHSRTAYLIMMTGFFIVGWTVHFWGAAYAAFIFLLGSGSWFLDQEPGEKLDNLSEPKVANRAPARFSRKRQAAACADSKRQTEPRNVRASAIPLGASGADSS